MILLDANVLLRLADKADAQYGPTVKAVFHMRQTETLAIVPRSL